MSLVTSLSLKERTMNNIQKNYESDYLLRACDLCEQIINSHITPKKGEYFPIAFDFISRRAQRKLIERYCD